MLIGNVGKEPNVNTTGSGQRVASFSLATSEEWRDQNGQTQSRTEWHNIVAWGKLAEIIGSYVHQGKKLYIEGRIQSRSYQDKNGVDRYVTEVIANEMIMLDNAGGNYGGGGDFSGRSAGGYAQQGGYQGQNGYRNQGGYGNQNAGQQGGFGNSFGVGGPNMQQGGFQQNNGYQQGGYQQQASYGQGQNFGMPQQQQNNGFAGQNAPAGFAGGISPQGQGNYNPPVSNQSPAAPAAPAAVAAAASAAPSGQDNSISNVINSKPVLGTEAPIDDDDDIPF